MQWVTVTGKEIFEAIEKDGFGALRESWFKIDKDTGTIEACLLGTAALNLGVNAGDRASTNGTLLYELDQYKVPTDSKWNLPYSEGIGTAIIRNFDEVNESVESIVYNQAYEQVLKETGDTVLRADDYDRLNEIERKLQSEFRKENPDYDEDAYALETWEECVQMAEDLLLPVWDTKFTLATYDFEKVFDMPIPQIDTSAPSLEMGLT